MKNVNEPVFAKGIPPYTRGNRPNEQAESFDVGNTPVHTGLAFVRRSFALMDTGIPPCTRGQFS